jgi:hypothetical protein
MDWTDGRTNKEKSLVLAFGVSLSAHSAFFLL